MTTLLRYRDVSQPWLIKEDYALVPRFSLKKKEVFADFPVNKALSASQERIVKAIKYGMVLVVTYKGDSDESDHGHDRTIYPMVLGKTKDGDLLLRAYHLQGWSQAAGHPVSKKWRMFRLDRISSMQFTGTFFRLAPGGYNMEDPGMAGGIILAADFSQIRDSQQELVAGNKVQGEDETNLKQSGVEVVEVNADDAGETLDLADPWHSVTFLREEQADQTRVTFLKSQFGNRRIALFGVLAKNTPDGADKMPQTIKLYAEGSLIGAFVVLGSCMAAELGGGQWKSVQGESQYDAFAYRGRR